MSPLTTFLCDLVDVREHRIKKDEVSKRWKAGNYRGVKADYAAWAIGLI